MGRLEKEDSSFGVLRVSKQDSDKSTRKKPRTRARTGPGFATWLRLPLSPLRFRTQVPSLKCCQLLLVSNNIDNEAPFIDKKRGGRNWYF